MRLPGADPENIEPGGANSINYQPEPGGAFFCITYKGEQGAPDAPPSKSAPGCSKHRKYMCKEEWLIYSPTMWPDQKLCFHMFCLWVNHN